MNALSLEVLENRNLLSMSAGVNSEPGLSNQQPIDVAEVSAIGTATASHDEAFATQLVGLATISSMRDGLWSDPTIWSSGRVPGPADDVVLANNVTIDHAQVHQLDINAGTTTLAGDLQAYASVVVRSRLVGAQGGIYFHVADDRLFTGNTRPGPDPTMPDFHPEDIGLWVLRGASIDLQGAEVSSWLNALGSGSLQDIGNGVSQQVAFRAGAATLQSAPLGWRSGDTLLLVNEHGQSRLAHLVSVSGASIQYQESKASPTDADLVGNSLITNGSSTTVYSKIANLTRRILVVGADVHTGDTNHRAHTTILDGATANLTNVEFRDLGPRGKIGRYPVYFDGGSAVTSKLIGSSIWQDITDPGNRFVTLRDVQGVTVTNNVAFRSRGDGFFMEGGSEYGNSIANNLSVDVTGDEELPNVDSSVTSLTHHFWLRTGNTISGNVAAGGDAVGMIILASTHPTTAVVNNTQALGTGLFGMWTATPNVTFNNPVAVYNSRAGFASEPAWDVDSHGTQLNNPLFLFNGTSDSAYGSQIYLNNSGVITVNGGVLAGVKAVHTHYHSAFLIANSQINVDTLLTPTYWEQAGIFDHASIHASLLFERSYPSPRYASPGLVRFTETNVQIGSEAVEVETADYMGDTFQNYPSLPGTPIPNAIELDHLAPASGFIRVTLLPDDERWMTNIARWTVTPIGQTPVADSFIYHRQTAWTQLAAFGGYPDGFPPGQYAVKLYDENGVLLKSGFAVVRSGQVSDLQDSLEEGPPQVVARQLFYNNSRYDGNNAAATATDDNAIATDKSAYLPGSGAATFANVSSYSKGINGVMVDIAGSHPNMTAADFIFRVGNNNSPSGWATANAPTSVSVRAGAGVDGSDRVEIIWSSGAPIKQWLQMIVKVNANTGLAQMAGFPAGQGDVFFFGNAVGDSGLGDSASNATVNSTDEDAARTHPQSLGNNLPITNIYDFSRDGKVNAVDQLIARLNGTNNATALKFLNVGSPPAAPQDPGAEVSSGDAGVASALTSPVTFSPTSAPDKWPDVLLPPTELGRERVANVLRQLDDGTRDDSSNILVPVVDKSAGSPNLTDDPLDLLFASLDLE
jgi:hypothetical protein